MFALWDGFQNGIEKWEIDHLVDLQKWLADVPVKQGITIFFLPFLRDLVYFSSYFMIFLELHFFPQNFEV